MIKPTLKRLWMHITSRRKKQLVGLLIIMVIASFAEVLSIGAVLPFLAVLMSPEKIFLNPYLQPVVAALGISEVSRLLLLLTVLFISAAIVAALVRMTLLWAQTRLSYAIGADLSMQIYERTLYQPYLVHVSRNSTQVIVGASIKVNQVVHQVLFPMLTAIGAMIIFIAILSVLIVIDPVMAITSFLGFGAVYTIIMTLVRKRLKYNSRHISEKTNQVLRALQEGLGGIRDVLLNGTQSAYCKAYRSADLPLRTAQANNQIISESPRFLIEGLGVTIIAALAYALTGREGGVAAAIPILGALAIGAQRLLPLMQQLYYAWSTLRGGQTSLNDVLDLMEQSLPKYVHIASVEPITYNKSITLDNVSFRYSEKTPWIIQGISLEIIKGTKVGFVGTTGGGKSTLLDILMALLQPEKGRLLVDGEDITKLNSRRWQEHVAHVPQSIFLADTTIAENISFGVSAEKIDYQRVEKAAQQAQIAKIIESWGRGYNTVVGERGIRLSGGQRQRIGIARALFKKADVIVFDEATSALDNETEAAVMDAINAIGNNITVLIVAHRLSTLKACDVIYELEAGQIKRQGSYREIVSDTKIVTIR